VCAHITIERLVGPTRTTSQQVQKDNINRCKVQYSHTLESIQQTTFHSVPSPSFLGTSIPTGALNNTSGVRDVPRSRSWASVSKGMPVGTLQRCGSVSVAATQYDSIVIRFFRKQLTSFEQIVPWKSLSTAVQRTLCFPMISSLLLGKRLRILINPISL
jgi:hypothetical protein